MTTLFIRYFSIIFCSIYCYHKVLNLNTDKSYYYIFNSLTSLFITTVVTLLFYKNIAFHTILLFTMYFTIVSVYSKIKLHISLIVTIISYAISYISLLFSGLIMSVIISMFFNTISVLSVYSIILGALLQHFFIYLIFKIKRLKKGMPFLLKSSILNLGVVICLFIILYNTILNVFEYSTSFIRGILLSLILLLALALLIWWRRKITQSYVEKLRVSEVEALYKEISDKEHEIEKLHSNNRYLARIIHKDNKLIPAMELAVRNYLQNGMQMKPEDARQYGIDLLAQLQTMAADREGIIQNYHDDYRFRPQIGLYSVDAIIYYMERRAIPHSIRYEYQFDKGLKEVMLSYIDENDAIHLLSDAIENSIIATMHAIKKEIKIHIGFIQDILFMDISDTGLPFEPATYQNFGLLQHTTHKDSGGSGVGLLDIWKLKHKYKISLQIYEYPPDDHEYTKKIRFFFDRRNHFLIQSYRSQEITSLITRSDLHVFPYVEGSDFILTLDEEITEEAE